MKLHKSLIFSLVIILLLTFPVFAQKTSSTQSDNVSGDISVMYFGATADTGISGAQSWIAGWPVGWVWGWNAIYPGQTGRTAGGFYADGNLYFSQRWGVGLDYNSNNINMGTFRFTNVPVYNNAGNLVGFGNVVTNISDFNLSSFTGKIKYQLSPPESKDGALRLYLLWRSYNWSWVNAGYNPSGLGVGLDGYFKMGDKWEGFGMIDYASVDGNVLNYSLNTSVWRFEAGVKYYFSEGFFGRLSYRGENFHFNRSPWSDATLNGPAIGIGVKF